MFIKVNPPRLRLLWRTACFRPNRNNSNRRSRGGAYESRVAGLRAQPYAGRSVPDQLDAPNLDGVDGVRQRAAAARAGGPGLRAGWLLLAVGSGHARALAAPASPRLRIHRAHYIPRS